MLYMAKPMSKPKSVRKMKNEEENPKAAEAAFSSTAAEAAPKPREIVQYRRPPRLNLADLDGETIVIIDYQLTTSPKFNAQMAVIRFFKAPEGKEEEAYTFSRVIIRQLTDEIDPLLKQGKAVEVKVVKTRKYLMLAPPDQ